MNRIVVFLPKLVVGICKQNGKKGQMHYQEYTVAEIDMNCTGRDIDNIKEESQPGKHYGLNTLILP